jgi:hypothetical protein
LWLPEGFEGGDLANDVNVIVDRLRSLGGKYADLAAMIEQNPSALVIIAYELNPGPSGFLTNVNVTKEQVLSGMTVNTYMEAGAAQFANYGFTVLEKGLVQLDNYEAGRIVIEATSLQAKEVMYIIKSNNTMWITTYATGISEFEDRLPMIEQSANTIKIR